MKPFKILLNFIFVPILMLSLFGCNKPSLNEDSTQSASVDEESANVDPDDYIFPESSEVLLTENQLTDLPIKLLELGRNEIFARHGYIFKTDELKIYFTQKSWYKANDSFNGEKDLNDIESKNISLIKSVEDKKNDSKADEKVYGKVKQVSIENGTKYIVFDKVEWLLYENIKNRQDVKDYLVKQYGSLPSEFPNDYYIYDPDNTLTKLQFNDNGTITNWKSDSTGVKTFPVSFEDLRTNLNKYTTSPQQGVYSISIENNSIIKLEKMYQP